MTKIHKSFVGILALLIIGIMFAVPTTIVKADSLNNGEKEISSYASISVPHVMVETYNVAVQYNWQVGMGGDEIALSPNGRDFSLMGDRVYRSNDFADGVGEKNCEPNLYAGKSYDSYSNTYSGITTLEHEVYMGDHYVVRYGYDANYNAVGIFPYWIFGPSATIPTSYDQEHYVWYHNSSNGHTIKGTIEYKGELQNIEVYIPWIGYKTSSVNVNGETFYLRTGPNRCSIIAKSSNLHAYDLKFAFGVD